MNEHSPPRVHPSIVHASAMQFDVTIMPEDRFPRTARPDSADHARCLAFHGTQVAGGAKTSASRVQAPNEGRNCPVRN